MKGTGANFQIKITFDENINSACITNAANWVVEVANAGRVGKRNVAITDVGVSGKVVTVKATVVETG